MHAAIPGFPGFIALFALTFALPAFTAEGPTRPDSIVFNHTVALENAENPSLPLYFTRRGYYFAEVYFDRAGAAGTQAPAPVRLHFTVDVLRRGELLFSRTFDEVVDGDARVATLFRVDTDREVPLKTRLDVVIRLDDLSPQVRDAIGSLTFQIRRKPNFRLGL